MTEHSDDLTPTDGAFGAPRKLKPHRGDLMVLLGILSLVAGPPIVSIITWVMARGDLKEMDAGQMDPAGRSKTSTARLLAIVSTIGWPVLFSCCCMGSCATQVIYGGRFFSAIGSRRITRQEFERVQFHMTKKQVKDILGTPARTEDKRDGGGILWFWHEKNGRDTFNVNFDSRDKVQGMGRDSPD